MNHVHNENGNGERYAWGLHEAARACGVSVPFLRKLIRQNEIKPTRAGRRVLISDKELKRYLGLAENSEQETA